MSFLFRVDIELEPVGALLKSRTIFKDIGLPSLGPAFDPQERTHPSPIEQLIFKAMHSHSWSLWAVVAPEYVHTEKNIFWFWEILSL